MVPVAVVVMSSKNVCGCLSCHHNKRWNTHCWFSKGYTIPFFCAQSHCSSLEGWYWQRIPVVHTSVPQCSVPHKLGTVVWWVLSNRDNFFIVCAVEPEVGRALCYRGDMSCKVGEYRCFKYKFESEPASTLAPLFILATLPCTNHLAPSRLPHIHLQ